MELKTKVREYIVENFLFGDTSPLTSDTISLLDEGDGVTRLVTAEAVGGGALGGDVE